MSKRKTIPVEEVKKRINARLAEKDLPVEAKKHLASLLEVILMTTDNYKGFCHLEWYREGGFERWEAAGKPEDKEPFLGDQWRREYF